jgi:hypothetical protein
MFFVEDASTTSAEQYSNVIYTIDDAPEISEFRRRQAQDREARLAFEAFIAPLWYLPIPWWAKPRDPMILEARTPKLGTVNRFIHIGAREGAPDSS